MSDESGFDQFARSLQRAQTLEEAAVVIGRIADSLGFGFFAHIRLRLPAGKVGPRYFGNYPQAWTRHYDAYSLQLIDPVWNRSLFTTEPFLWSDVAAEADSESQRHLFAAAATFGLCSGLGIPIHRPFGTVSSVQFATSDKGDQATAALHKYHDILPTIAGAVEDCIAVLAPLHPVEMRPLTRREKQVLLAIRTGATYPQIGEKLGISRDTVRDHASAAIDKLGAVNGPQAAALAYQLGLIGP